MNIHIGFEIGTGRRIEIPLGHQVVTGQTQESGKTTTQEALIVRSGKRAVAFLTKRGEESFRIARTIPPYFQQEIGWQFVASVLEATLGERLKEQRSEIMKVCRPSAGREGSWPMPKTLADVRTNVQIALTKAARGWRESMLTQLDEYLLIVVPQIERLPYSNELVLTPGLNVMDLLDYTTEVQALVIRSVLKHLHKNEKDVVCIVPECWKFIPQKHSSPVKDAAEAYVREGGVLKNYLWLDSQDIAGFSPEVKRQIKVWILGVQREKNEVQRTLDHIPGDIRKPKREDIMRLGKGQFFVSYGDELVRVYVQPAWMNSELHAQAIARGDEKVETAREILKEWDRKDAREKKQETAAVPDVQWVEQNLPAPIDLPPVVAVPLKDGVSGQAVEPAAATRQPSNGPEKKPPLVEYSPGGNPLRVVEVEESVYLAIVARLKADAPGLVRLLAEAPALEVSVKRPVVETTSATAFGKVCVLCGDGFLKTPRTVNDVRKEIIRRTSKDPSHAGISRELKRLAEMGILFYEEKSFVLNPAAKVTVKEI